MTRDEESLKLRRVSLIAYGVERLFRLLQRLSPASRLRGRITELYIAFWLGAGTCLSAACHAAGGSYPTWLVYAVFVVAGLRITDVAQATVNIGVFDHLGQGTSQEVEDVLRSVILLLFNNLELVFWFGLIYLPLCLKGADRFADSFYFSAVTQLTVGYGDITPAGAAKVVAPLQATLGWLLSLLVIARFVSALPNIRKSSLSDSQLK